MSEMQTGVETPEQTYARQQAEAQQRWRDVAYQRDLNARRLSLLPPCPLCGGQVWYVDGDVARCNRCANAPTLAWTGTVWQS